LNGFGDQTKEDAILYKASVREVLGETNLKIKVRQLYNFNLCCLRKEKGKKKEENNFCNHRTCEYR